MDNLYCLAVDIGASGGRHILCHIENGRMITEEIYRFGNGLVNKNGHLCWDAENLFAQVKEGMKRCREKGRIPSFMGIDTWGVDFVLLDKNDRIIGDCVGYRDARTENMDRAVCEIIGEKELYARTGIQKQIFNTIYQLMYIKHECPADMERAETFLMMPDYLNFRLTGIKHSEYTNATTSQLVNIRTNDWDRELIDSLGFNGRLFGELHMPGEKLAPLSEEVAKEVGYSLTVMHPASHDTGSAVLAMPSDLGGAAYLNSGTWSLIGVENSSPICTEEARRCNFTNEGGYDYRYRFLKNIMGLWMIQSVRKECADRYSFDDIARMAEQNARTQYRVDVNDSSFLMPRSMIDAVKDYCKNPSMTLGEVVGCIYNSLSESYSDAIGQIAHLTGRRVSALHIIGGGSRDGYLNMLTAEKCGIPVFAGPTEATAIGNIASQLLGIKYFSDVSNARKCIYNSFEVRKIEK